MDFRCTLETAKCSIHGCEAVTSYPIGFCENHLRSEKKLEVRLSSIANAGYGIFAYDPEAGQKGEAVFSKGSIVVGYLDGLTEEMKKKTMLSYDRLKSRYGTVYRARYKKYVPIQGPYCLSVKKELFADTACCRTAASFINRPNIARNDEEEEEEEEDAEVQQATTDFRSRKGNRTQPQRKGKNERKEIAPATKKRKLRKKKNEVDTSKRDNLVLMNGTLTFRALRNIYHGDELLFKYAYDPAKSFADYEYGTVETDL